MFSQFRTEHATEVPVIERADATEIRDLESHAAPRREGETSVPRSTAAGEVRWPLEIESARIV
jgi:hypothetical protein